MDQPAPREPDLARLVVFLGFSASLLLLKDRRKKKRGPDAGPRTFRPVPPAST